MGILITCKMFYSINYFKSYIFIKSKVFYPEMYKMSALFFLGDPIQK